MELEQKLKTLQIYYAAALADCTTRYGNEGILEKITEQKRVEQGKAGASLAERFGVKEPWQAFEKTQEVYGCADWVRVDTENGFAAVASNCMLCAISKKMGPHSPCQIHCLTPIETMLKAVAPNMEFIVEKTLWNGDQCSVKVELK